MGGACFIIWGIIVAIVIAVGFVFWAGLAFTLTFTVVPKGKRLLTLLISMPSYALVCGAVGAGIYFMPPPSGEAIYEMSFNSQASPTVQVHQAELSDWSCDSESTSIYFNASPADIQQISSSWLTLDPNYAATRNGVASTNYGQIPLAGKDIYTGVPPNNTFYTANAVLIYDPATGEAWYEYFGID